MRRAREKGQVVILVLLALSLFVIGAIGLAIDGSQLYAHRQMAQAAADSAAQAAVMSMLGKKNTDEFNTTAGPTCPACAFGTSDFTCTNGTDGRTPCVYARLNGFGAAGSSDVVDVSFPDASTAPGVRLSPLFSPKLVTVTITRPVGTTLIRWVGAAATANVRVSATAAIVQDDAPVPILVLHPTKCEAWRRGGDSTVQICGGPDQSIQVNSDGTESGCNPSRAVEDNGNGAVDLSKAGPNGDSSCTSAPNQGGIFGTFGPPDSYPGTLLVGDNGSYQRRATITDPYIDVYFPNGPDVPPPPVSDPEPRAPTVNGCPAAPPKPCMLYHPGYYPDGIEVKNEVALFEPGLYYMGSKGFAGAAGSTMLMAQDVAADTVYGTGAGMVVYSSGPVVSPGVVDAGKFQVGSQGAATLLGPPVDSVWEGILLFQDRRSVPHIGSSGGHKLGGGGALSLTGSIYLTNAEATTNSRYQELILRGSGGNTTRILGNIVVDILDSGGTGDIQMGLNPNEIQVITRVALVK